MGNLNALKPGFLAGGPQIPNCFALFFSRNNIPSWGGSAQAPDLWVKPPVFGGSDFNRWLGLVGLSSEWLDLDQLHIEKILHSLAHKLHVNEGADMGRAAAVTIKRM